MNKVYLGIYLNKNLGDDIFAKIISERYPNTKFYTFLRNNTRYNFRNMKIYNGIFYRGINKILKKFSNNKISIPIKLAKKCEAAIVIGGSMFIEGKSGNKEELNFAKNSFIIGSNFGPFKDANYPKSFESLFRECNCVSFRDEYSYSLFSNLGDNIQYAPDIVFGLDTSKISIKNSNKIVFSIIDCKSKIDKIYEKDYDQKIIEMTKYFLKKKYEIVYMSFCKNEGDEEAINRILSKINIKERMKIEKYFYRDNINEALNVLADSKIIVGSRFHANILGLVLNKTIIPIIYSDKTVNALNDINFEGRKIDIRNLQDFDVNKLNEEDLKYTLDISKYSEESEKHFHKLDQILKQ